MLPIYNLKLSCNNNVIMNKVQCCWTPQNWILCALNKNCDEYGVDTIHFINANRPDDTFMLNTQHNCVIDHLNWINQTNSFITVDEEGLCKLWSNSNREYFMNVWECINKFNLGDGDRIIKLLVVNNKRMFNWDVEKMHQKDLLHKFPQNVASGFVLEEKNVGIVAITATGVFHLVILKADETPVIHKTKLVLYKSFVHSADIIINSSGKIFAAIQTDPAIIELFTVNCKLTSADDCDFSTEVWPCIVPQFQSGNNTVIAGIKCISVISSDKVVVSVNTSNHTSCIQIFEIKKEPIKLHPHFPSQQQQPQTADTCVCLQNVKFQQKKSVQLITGTHFVNIARVNDLFFTPICLLSDFHSLQFFSLFELTKPLNTYKWVDKNNIVCSALSPCQQAVFTVTENGTGILYSLSQFGTNQDKEKVKNIVNLLQYSMIESFSPWSIVLSMCVFEKHLIEQCYKQFLEDFHDNIPSGMQSLIAFNRIQRLILSTKKDYCFVLEYTYSLILSSVYHFIVSLLASPKEAIFFESVEKVCTTSSEFEINKIIPLLDIKDFNFTLLTINSHKTLIQWIIDYAIHLARLILSKNHCGQSWKAIIPYLDSNTLLCLCKLLVVFYVMYQKNPKLPHIHAIFVSMADSLEIISYLFKLAAKFQKICQGDTNIEIIVNDLPFNTLPMMHLQLPSIHPNGGVLEQIRHFSSSEIQQYNFDNDKKEWWYLHQTALQSPLFVGISTVSTGLRQIYDGVNFTHSSLIQGEVLKQCNICNCISVQVRHSSRTYNLEWVENWKQYCFCGGEWIQIPWHN